MEINGSLPGGDKPAAMEPQSFFPWQRDGCLPPLSNGLERERVQVRSRVRGKTIDASVSLRDIVERPFFQWWQEDQEGAKKALLRDAALRNSVNATLELMDAAQDGESFTTIQSYAFLERLMEVDQLATPHIPRFIHEGEEAEGVSSSDHNGHGQDDCAHDYSPKEEIGSRGDSGKNPLEAVLSFLKQLNNKAIKQSLATERQGPQKKEAAALSRIAMKFIDGQSTHTASPYTNPPTVTGMDRYGRREKQQFPGDKNVPKDTLIEYIYHRSSQCASFAILSIANSYNPDTGELLTVADKRPYIKDLFSFSLQRENGAKQLIHVPREDAQKAKEVILPHPIQLTDRRKEDVSHRDVNSSLLDDIAIFSKKDYKQLFYELDFTPYVFIDSLGNLSLNIQLMPPEVRSELGKQDLVISANFVDTHGTPWYRFMRDDVSEEMRIGPHKEPAARTLLYPPEIQKLLSTLRQKYNEQVDGFATKEQVFAKIAQFLGNYWLTYDKRDAPRSLKDPIAATQTDRVLNSRIASCEGANIALGELMRHFLDDGEGIVYVLGLPLHERSRDEKVATGDSLHLKVAYGSSSDQVLFLDATPWGKPAKKQIERTFSEHKRLKRAWHDSLRRRQEQWPRSKTGQKYLSAAEIRETADEAWDGLWEVWNFKENIANQNFNPLKRNFSLWSRLPGSLDPNLSVLVQQTNEFFRGNFLQKHEKMFFVDDGISRTPIDATMQVFRNPFTYSLFGSRRPHTSLLSSDYLPDNYEGRLSFEANTSHYADLYLGSLYATVHNSEVVTTFSEQLMILTEEYEGRFKQVLMSAQDKIPSGDVDAFFDQAPFLMLLPHPLAELDGFFSHSWGSQERGFLLPSSERDIAKKIDIRLCVWREVVDDYLETISKLLRSVPLTKSPTSLPVVFPETRFWPKDTTIDPADELDSDQKYLDALSVFEYLASALDQSDGEIPSYHRLAAEKLGATEHFRVP